MTTLNRTLLSIAAGASIVAAFLVVPESAIAATWAELGAVQLNPEMALDGKATEFLGRAVGAQIAWLVTWGIAILVALPVALILVPITRHNRGASHLRLGSGATRRRPEAIPR
jgi:hypothetical protein